MTEPKEALLRNVITHATGGNCTGEGMGLNDICVSISAHRNEVYARGVERGKTTLAAENALLREKLAEREALLRECREQINDASTAVKHLAWRRNLGRLVDKIDTLTGGDND